jgi:hypothetical protein
MAGVTKGAAPAAPAVPHLVKAVVAPGRSLSLNGHRFGPGEHVELSVEDHAHLISSGFLYDPRTVPPKPVGVVTR